MHKPGHACYLEALSGLCEPLRRRLSELDGDTMDRVREIRLIAGAPPMLLAGARMIALANHPPVLTRELEQSVISLCGMSVHTHQRELAQGFISLAGGHRAGVAGTAVYDTQGKLQCVRDITAIVIRVAREIPRAADVLIAQTLAGGVTGLLIAGRPGSGKTTLLRDLARQLSGGAVRGCSRVAVVDERGELSQIGDGVCALRGYNKGEGILQAVRALSPQVVICDEIGGSGDVEAVRWALNCGVAVIASIHAGSAADFISREAGRRLLETGAFAMVAVLSDSPLPGTLEEVVSGYELGSRLRHRRVGDELLVGRYFDGDGLQKTGCRA